MVDYKKYKAFLIQNSNSGAPIDTNSEWGVLVKSCPFKLLPEPKEFATNDWVGEDGEDVFFPDKIAYKAYDLSVTFVCVAQHGTANFKIKSLWDYLQSPPLKFYDTYTGIGRQNIYYKSFNPQSLYRKDGDNDVVEFTMTFRVCDPVSDIVLSQTNS